MAYQYSISEENAVRSTSHLAEYYRARLNEEMRREKVIEVQARRVSFEEESNHRAGRPMESPGSGKSASDPGARGRSAESDKAAFRWPAARLTAEFAYAPGNAQEAITLRPSPKARGLFIDLMA